MYLFSRPRAFFLSSFVFMYFVREHFVQGMSCGGPPIRTRRILFSGDEFLRISSVLCSTLFSLFFWLFLRSLSLKSDGKTGPKIS